MSSIGRAWARTLTCFAVLTASLVLGHGPAQASYDSHCEGYPSWPCHQQPKRWRDDWAVTGLCASPSYRRGGYPLSVQSILWANNNFSSTASIDGYVGSATDTAIKNYQRAHGRTADGCVGYYTWITMQEGSHRVWNSVEQIYETYPHMVVVSRLNAGTQYDYGERHVSSRRVRYHIDADTVGCVYVRKPGTTATYGHLVVEYQFQVNGSCYYSAG